MTNDLFLAILAMDSYNRGDTLGLNLAGLGASGTHIGMATIDLNSDEPAAGMPNAAAAGFSAQAYTWNGQTVISYRGTDSGADYWRGWTQSLGIEATWTQADEALAFYKTVTEQDYWQGPAANTILTGHSLGGGLAGLTPANANDCAAVAALTRRAA